MKSHVVLLVALLLALIPRPMYATEPVKVGIYQNNPLVFWDDTGPHGIFVDILNYIGATEGWQLEYSLCNWNDCLIQLEHGEIDLLPSIAYSKERANIYDFTSETVITNWGQLYTLPNSEIQSFLDLKDHNIAVLKNDIHYRAFTELLEKFEIPVTYVETEHYDDVLRLVEQKNVAAGLVNRIYGAQHEGKYNVEKSTIIFNPIEVRIAAPKGQNQHLLQAIDTHLVALKQNPQSIYYQSLNKWLAGLKPTNVIPSWLYWWLSGSIIMIAIFFAGMVTLRQQVQRRTKQLATSERRYRNLVDSAPIGIMAFDRAGNITTTNPALLKLGLPLDSTAKVNIFTTPYLANSEWSAITRKCLDSGTALTTELPYTNATGKTSFLRAHFSPTFDDNKVVIGGQALIEDITALKEAQTALRQEQEELHTIVQSISDYVWSADVVDGHEKYRYYSPVVEKITGYAPDFFMRSAEEGWLSIVHPQDLARVKEHVKRYINGEFITHEYRIIRADGQVKWVYATISPTKDEQGQVIRLDGVVSDITDRKHLEEQLHQAQKLEAIGTLAGGIAHDFNNILTAIMGYTGLTLQALPPDSPIRPDIEGIERISQRGAGLVRQLLAFARRQIITPQVVNLNDLLLNASQMLKRLISEDIELVILPIANPNQVNIDPGQFEQVLFNMVINARDAMPNGGKLIIKTQNCDLPEEYRRQNPELLPGPYVLLTVTDTGIGMTKEIKQRIFEPFFTTKTVGKGSGLGLATCIGIIKQNKGHITVDSVPNEGSTFNIYLPLVVEQETESAQKSKQDYLPCGTETILLVEDEETVRELAWRTLEHQGYKVLQATNGTDALRLLQTQTDGPVHLLLTDIVMPHMGGMELAEVAKTKHPRLKILFMTGYSEKVLVNPTAGNFLKKPFSPSTLACKVREILDRPHPQ